MCTVSNICHDHYLPRHHRVATESYHLPVAPPTGSERCLARTKSTAAAIPRTRERERRRKDCWTCRYPEIKSFGVEALVIGFSLLDLTLCSDHPRSMDQCESLSHRGRLRAS